MWPQIFLTIEQRQFLTRALCWVIVASAAGLLVICVGALVVLATGMLDVAGATALFMYPVSVLGVTHIAAAALLWFWRSCDRCSYHLYPYQDVGGVNRPSPLDTDYPDYRAERFLGSWRWGVILSMATKGVAHCMRCGHQDGVEPEFSIKR
jgi:hypothetical protein